MSVEPLIRLEKVTKNYRIGDETVRALAGVDLEVAEGEFIALVGPSGSGKSTMLHIIGGLDSPSSGEVIVAGRNLSQASDNQLSRYRNRSVGFVFQTFNLHPTLNALENVALPLVFSGVPHRKRLEAARQALEEVGLAERAGHRPNQLSGGERQRVSIARALVAGPKIILADEPTGNLDSKTGERIIALLLRLNRERGITTILVTHDLDIAGRVPRILYMRDGSIVDERRA
jgi:putative ABC transport system ATP-binding protein